MSLYSLHARFLIAPLGSDSAHRQIPSHFGDGSQTELAKLGGKTMAKHSNSFHSAVAD
jgi:hypothetical protein